MNPHTQIHPSAADGNPRARQLTMLAAWLAGSRPLVVLVVLIVILGTSTGG